MQKTKNLTISLGKPITAPVLIPVKHNATPTCINNPFTISGQQYSLTAMSFGTPHGAVFVEDVNNIDVSILGLELGTHPRFPKGASIVFVQVIDSENLKARLWQRGEGERLFTPEAACVAGTAAIKLQKIPSNHTATVSMGGTPYHVQWDRGNENVSISGPAKYMG